MAKKQVRVSCHGPIAFSKHYKVSWEDVWLRWKTKPTKTHYKAPTLMSRSDLETELEINQLCMEDTEWNNTPYFINEKQKLLNILNHLAVESDLYFDGDDIYTSKESIDRDEAERMIREYMKRQGFSHVNLKWRKPSRPCVIPM